jgi:hypothetical protein
MNAKSTSPSAEQPRTFAVGDRVFLRGARFGLPGTILRLERGRAVVFWEDLDHISRHRPVTLMLAKAQATNARECGA